MTPWWAISLIQFATAVAFGCIMFSLGAVYGEARERKKPRTITAAQVMGDKLNLIYAEAKERGNHSACEALEEQGRLSGKQRTTWVVHRMIVVAKGEDD